MPKGAGETCRQRSFRTRTPGAQRPYPSSSPVSGSGLLPLGSEGYAPAPGPGSDLAFTVQGRRTPKAAKGPAGRSHCLGPSRHWRWARVATSTSTGGGKRPS